MILLKKLNDSFDEKLGDQSIFSQKKYLGWLANIPLCATVISISKMYYYDWIMKYFITHL